MPGMISHSAEETFKFGEKFSKKVRDLPALILLSGDLGAGKTEWSKGFIKGYLKSKIVVTSPTYSVVNVYKQGERSVFHVDLYRLSGIDDLESIGFWDFLEGKNVIIVEWGNKLPHQWSSKIHVFEIEFKMISENVRELTYPALF